MADGKLIGHSATVTLTMAPFAVSTALTISTVCSTISVSLNMRPNPRCAILLAISATEIRRYSPKATGQFILNFKMRFITHVVRIVVKNDVNAVGSTAPAKSYYNAEIGGVPWYLLSIFIALQVCGLIIPGLKQSDGKQSFQSRNSRTCRIAYYSERKNRCHFQRID